MPLINLSNFKIASEKFGNAGIQTRGCWVQSKYEAPLGKHN